MPVPTALEIRNFLEGYGVDHLVLSDDWIDDRIANNVVPYVERITRLSFSAIASVTELYSGNGKNIMLLNRRPIVAVTSIRYVLGGSNLTYLNLNNIEISKQQGILKAKRNYEESYYLPVFAKGDYNIEVTYTYGYATMPNDVSEAVKYLTCEQLLGFIASRTGGGDLSGEGWSRSFGTRGKYSAIRNDLARQARFLLARYMTRIVG
jgi:hypothetical protein